VLRDLLTAASHPDADRTATMLVLLRDGLVIAGGLDGVGDTRALVREAVTRVLT
jgi:hypothetical protein